LRGDKRKHSQPPKPLEQGIRDLLARRAVKEREITQLRLRLERLEALLAGRQP